ncbi:MAG: hypothetical protein HY695_25255 [Deltaproteobacteria bacterium]|nr:hypothetical protein [Deltaproteobacteria bacterium]
MTPATDIIRTMGPAPWRPGYFRRIRIYLNEMYPLPKRVLFSALAYVSLAALLRRVNRVDAPLSLLVSFIGIWSFFAVMLILRLMDELKDKEIDSRLFPYRPLPSGRILESDIVFSMAAVIIFYLAANLWAGPAFWMALVVLGYCLIMFKHFFIPHILRRSLLLTLATHNPVVPLLLSYALTLFAIGNQLPLADLNWPSSVFVVVMDWAPVFAWEIARKIRSRDEETEYVTYSQIFGRVGSVLIAGGAQTVTFFIGLYFAWTLSLSLAFITLWCAGYLIPIWAYARFIQNPTPATSKLGPYAEAYLLIVLAVQIIGALSN